MPSRLHNWPRLNSTRLRNQDDPDKSPRTPCACLRPPHVRGPSSDQGLCMRRGEEGCKEGATCPPSTPALTNHNLPVDIPGLTGACILAIISAWRDNLFALGNIYCDSSMYVYPTKLSC